MGFKLGRLSANNIRFSNFTPVVSETKSKTRIKESSSSIPTTPTFYESYESDIKEILTLDLVVDLAKLLSKGLPLTFEIHGLPLLTLALDHAAYNSATLLVQKGADVNYVSSNGQVSLLSRYTTLGNISAIQFLLDHKANVNLNLPVLSNPLYIAVVKENAPVVKILVDAGADTAIQVGGKTLIEYVAITWY